MKNYSKKSFWSKYLVGLATITRTRCMYGPIIWLPSPYRSWYSGGRTISNEWIVCDHPQLYVRRPYTVHIWMYGYQYKYTFCITVILGFVTSLPNPWWYTQLPATIGSQTSMRYSTKKGRLVLWVWMDIMNWLNTNNDAWRGIMRWGMEPAGGENGENVKIKPATEG